MLIGVAEDELVISQPERVLKHGHWDQVRVRVATLRLVAGATIVVPLGQI